MEDVSEGDEGEDKQRACIRWNEKEGKPAVQLQVSRRRSKAVRI